MFYGVDVIQQSIISIYQVWPRDRDRFDGDANTVSKNGFSRRVKTYYNSDFSRGRSNSTSIKLRVMAYSYLAS